MKKPADERRKQESIVRLMGLGRKSIQKSYYPQLQKKIAELNEEKEKYRLLVDNSGDAIYLMYNRRFEHVNSRFLDMFNLTAEQISHPQFDPVSLIAPKSRPLLEDQERRALAGETPDPNYIFTGLTSDGREIEIEAAVTYFKFKEGTAVQAILRDITDRVQLEEQLRQSQKMEIVGQLAGGVAHDFNNLLTIITGYSDIILTDPQTEPGIIEKIEQIRKASDRAALSLTSC